MGNKTIFLRRKDKTSPLFSSFLYKLMATYCLVLIAIGLFSESMSDLWWGMQAIFLAPSNLTTDYFAVGNFGSTFFNSGILTFVSLALAWYKKVELNGPMLAAFFTVSGFSFFGKDIFNSIPIFLGVLCYARLVKKPYSQFSLIALFGSAVSPVISYIAFGTRLPVEIGVLLGYLVGILIGIILPPLSAHFLQFHQGFSLYNVGFTSGIIAMFIANGLRLFGHEIVTPQLISTQYSSSAMFFLIILSIILIIIGLFLHASWNDLKKIFSEPGTLITDFIALSSTGATLINMGIMGLLMILFVILMKGSFSGPIVGAVLTVMGFSAFGNHWKNSLPILLGVFLASLVSPNYGNDPFPIILTALFGTSLAPIAGNYGTIPGVFAGFIHMTLVSNVGFLHGGLNLYNNGFSCGFVAAFMVPILNNLQELKEHRNERKRTNSSYRG